MGKKIKSLKGSQCCEGMHFGGKTGCIEKMFVKLEMTRASPGSSLVIIIFDGTLKIWVLRFGTEGPQRGED